MKKNKYIIIFVTISIFLTCSNGHSQLFKAAWRGDMETVMQEIQKGNDINLKDEDGDSLLMISVSIKNYQMAKYLLEHGVDINLKDNKGWTALIKACSQGDVKIVELLLNYKADPYIKSIDGNDALISACGNGNIEIVKMLLAKKVNINSEGFKKITPLMASFGYNKNIKLAKLLINYGANIKAVNENNESVLFRAISSYENASDNIKIVRLLLDRGVDIDTQSTVDGSFPLLNAIDNGNIEIVRMLINKDAVINKRGKQGAILDWATPLIMAISKDDKEIVNLLLGNGADPNFANWKEETALHYAIADNKYDMVKLLLEKGGSINRKDKMGDTPLDIAKKRKYEKILELIKKYKCKKKNCNS
jgi:ankyrin repeat protein